MQKYPIMYTHGGKRKGSGRKPVTDPKQQVNIYPHASEVEAVGGIEAAKELAIRAIQRKAKGLKKS